MKSAGKTKFFNKTILSGAISSALTVGVGLSTISVSQADIYEFSFSNGTGVTANDALFTMLTSAGVALQNTSYPYYGDPTWGYGIRTQINGSLRLDIVSGNGNSTIDGFEFFNGANPAVANSITMVDIDDANDPSGNLWLTNMLFDWNVTIGIPVSLVWDMQGLLGALPDIPTVIQVNDVVTGVGVLPASDGISKGNFPIGVVPVATTAFNTTPLCTADPVGPPIVSCLGVNPSGTLPLIVDGTDIGGSPMIDGPFQDFNANFDFVVLTLAAYNDTTIPVLTLNPTSLNLAVGDAFDANNPGVSVTCLDNADGSDDLTAAVGTNPDIDFNIDNGNGGPAVDTGTAGSYEVLYTCTDNAVARAPISDDPNNPGNPTVPASNTSVNTTVLTVNVAGAGIPTITITNGTPTAHEACTVYADAGATAFDTEDGDITASIVVTDATPIIGAGNEQNEGSYPIDYDVTDSDLNAAATQTRTVDVTDTLPPVLTVIGAPFNIESTACVAFNAILPVADVVDANNCNQGAVIATTANTVNCIVPDGLDTVQSTLLYSADDLATIPNTGNASAVVTVARSEPVITLIGGGVVLGVGDAYTEQGMDIHDVQDGDVNAVVASGTDGATGITYTITDNIDTSTAGNYTVTYTATDTDTNDAAQVQREVTVGVFAEGSNFTMLDAQGNVFGGTNDVIFDWDQSENTSETDLNFNMSIASLQPFPFFGFEWTAHDIRVFGPGSYSFDSGCTVAEIQATGCLAGSAANSGTTISMTVPAGMVGAHILFDWNTTDNIDVVNVWDASGTGVWDRHGGTLSTNKLYDGLAGEAPDPLTTWKLVSTDLNADGFNGSPMVDGPFQGFYANFNAGPGGTAPPPEPYAGTAPDTKIGTGLASMTVWGLFAGLLTLFGFRRFSKKQ